MRFERAHKVGGIDHESFEFAAKISRGGKIGLPKPVLKQIAPGHAVRMLILVDDSEEKQEWQLLAVEEFFKDYDSKDSAYDKVK